MTYRNPLAVAFLVMASFFLVQSSHAQSRNVGAQSFIMDDGAGHFFTMQAPAGMTGSINYQFALPPAGAATGFVTAGTAPGQTLFWNTTAGHNAWEPSSIITNNTNGDGTNVTITAPIIGVLGSQFSGNGVGNTLTVGNAGAGDGLTVNNTGTGKALNATGPVAINGTLLTTGSTNVGSNTGLTNHFGDGATLNFFGETGAGNRFGIAATTNTFGGTALAAATQTNNMGNTSAASTLTNTIGQAGVAGASVTTTIGGGAGTSNVAINSTGWSATGAGVLSSTSLNVGNATQFTINNTGNVTKLNNVTTSFPSAQGAQGSVLTNDGTGTLTWTVAGSTSAQVTSTNATYTGGGALSTDQNAMAISSTGTFFKIDATASNVNVNGIDATGTADGRVVYFANTGNTGNTVTFVNASGLAAANNQFLMSGDVTIANNTTASFIYDATAHKWRLLAYSN